MHLRKLLQVFIVGIGLAGITISVAADGSSGSLEKELQARLDYAYGPVWASGDATRFVNEFLTDDAVVTASDAPTVWKGRARSIELIKDLMKSISSLRAKAVYTRSLDPHAAFQFVVFDLTARDPSQQKSLSAAKSLYVWVKTKHGWRVAADHYSFAGMDMPP
ncbi:MAG: YybH family protein [Steroidobacteraceae bacterium]